MQVEDFEKIATLLRLFVLVPRSWKITNVVSYLIVVIEARKLIKNLMIRIETTINVKKRQFRENY